MASDTDLLLHVYDRFNARDMEAVLATMREDVVWANGLEGGYVYGHAGVRDYWTRQWATIDSHAEPVGFSIGADGTTEVEVHLTARDLEGKPLFDKMGRHVFRIGNGLIRRFDIR
jgi:ketosteroid isomerase-like protein